MPVSSPGSLVRSLPGQVAKSLWQKHVNRAWSAVASSSSESFQAGNGIEYEQALDGQKYDVAIVGAGIMGEWGGEPAIRIRFSRWLLKNNSVRETPKRPLPTGSCTAYELAKMGGLKVLLLEQFDYLHRSAARPTPPFLTGRPK